MLGTCVRVSVPARAFAVYCARVARVCNVRVARVCVARVCVVCVLRACVLRACGWAHAVPRELHDQVEEKALFALAARVQHIALEPHDPLHQRPLLAPGVPLIT